MNIWKKMSIIRRVNFSFSFLLALLILVGGLGLYQAQQQGQYLNRFTSQTSPQMLEVSKLVLILLNAKSELNQLVHLTLKDDIEGSKNHVADQYEAFKQSEQRLVRLFSQQQTDAIDKIKQFPPVAFTQAGTWYDSHLAILTAEDALTPISAQFALDSTKLKRTVYGLSASSDNMNAGFMANTLSSGIDSLTFNTEKALKTTDVNQIQQLLEKNQSLAKRLEATSTDLAKNTRKYTRTAQKQLIAVIAQASGKEGMVAKHLHAMEQHQDLKVKVDESIQQISQQIEVLMKLSESSQKMADDFVKTAIVDQQKTRTQTLLLIIVAALLTILIAVSISRQVRLPLHRLLVVLKSMSNGHFTQNLNFKQQDEFGQLGRDFDLTIERLKVLLESFSDASEELNQLAQKNQQSVQNTQSELDSQNVQTTSVASAMHEMEHSIGEVASAAQYSSEHLKDVDSSAIEGRALVEQNQAQSKRLSESLMECNQVINKLNDDCTDIGQILDVIETIAEQTNLLALNAAIESARAGSHGRGFAVVADEVRELASRTAQSTHTIQSMIKVLRKSASQAVDIVSECNQGMQSSLAVSSKTQQSMTEIQSKIQVLTEQSEQIAVAAQQQKEVSMTIAESITEISGGAAVTLENSQKVAANSQTLKQLSQRQQEILASYTW